MMATATSFQEVTVKESIGAQQQSKEETNDKQTRSEVSREAFQLATFAIAAPAIKGLAITSDLLGP